MKAAILAAGLGSRLSSQYPDMPKALIEVKGRSLIEHQLIALLDCGFSDITIVIRDERVKSVCLSLKLRGNISFLVRETKSAFFSFLELRSCFPNDDFGLFTVDTFAPLSTYRKFTNSINENPDVDLLLGITDYINDDSPVRVLLDERMIIYEIGKHINSSKYIATGMHYLSSSVWELVPLAINNGISHFRDFLNFIVQNDCKIASVTLEKVYDIDDIQDVIDANKL